MVKAPIKPKRELATKNIRIYPKSLALLQDMSLESGKSIARIVDEAAQYHFEENFQSLGEQ